MIENMRYVIYEQNPVGANHNYFNHLVTLNRDSTKTISEQVIAINNLFLHISLKNYLLEKKILPIINDGTRCEIIIHTLATFF